MENSRKVTERVRDSCSTRRASQDHSHGVRRLNTLSLSLTAVSVRQRCARVSATGRRDGCSGAGEGGKVRVASLSHHPVRLQQKHRRRQRQEQQHNSTAAGNVRLLHCTALRTASPSLSLSPPLVSVARVSHQFLLIVLRYSFLPLAVSGQRLVIGARCSSHPRQAALTPLSVLPRHRHVAVAGASRRDWKGERGSRSRSLLLLLLLLLC